MRFELAHEALGLVLRDWDPGVDYAQGYVIAVPRLIGELRLMQVA